MYFTLLTDLLDTFAATTAVQSSPIDPLRC